MKSRRKGYGYYAFCKCKFLLIFKSVYSQLSPCGHLANMDTQTIQTTTESPAKISNNAKSMSCVEDSSLMFGPGVQCKLSLYGLMSSSVCSASMIRLQLDTSMRSKRIKSQV